MSSVESPDLMPSPGKGKGVRRLNNRPLLVVGLIVFAAISGVMYTFYDRQAQSRRAASDQLHPPVPTAATALINPTGMGYIPALSEAVEVAPSLTSSMEVPQAPSLSTIPTAAATTAPPPPPSEEYMNRIRLLQRIEERRLAQLEAALGANVSVQGFGRDTQTRTAAEASTGDDRMQALRQQLIAAATNAAAGGSSSGAGGFGSGGSGTGMEAENRQADKLAFLSGTPEANTYLNSQRRNAVIAPQEIKAGTIIPGVMISGLNSDLPGQIIAQVRENVYDSATGTQLLIPSGARLVGTYDSGVTMGQERALVGWTRIIYPDSSSISLDRMPGTDASGFAGFNDRVNNHYGRIFGSALLLSVMSAGVQLSQPQASNGQNYSPGQTIAGATGAQMGQLGMQIAQRGLNIQPTLEVRPGYQFNVMVTKDIILPRWNGHPMAASPAP